GRGLARTSHRDGVLAVGQILARCNRNAPDDGQSPGRREGCLSPAEPPDPGDPPPGVPG
ncbi:MAG: hypothetical protein AVDCRST_MAG70-1714, partial [uncultured Thermomicrobiales bacterium]